MLYQLTVSIPGHSAVGNIEANFYFDSEQCPTRDEVLQKLSEESRAYQQLIDTDAKYSTAVNEFALAVSSIWLCGDFPVLNSETLVTHRSFFKSQAFRCEGSVSIRRIGKVFKL